MTACVEKISKWGEILIPINVDKSGQPLTNSRGGGSFFILEIFRKWYGVK